MELMVLVPQRPDLIIGSIVLAIPLVCVGMMVVGVFSYLVLGLWAARRFLVWPCAYVGIMALTRFDWMYDLGVWLLVVGFVIVGVLIVDEQVRREVWVSTRRWWY